MATLGSRDLLPPAAATAAVLLTLLTGTTLALWPASPAGDLRRKVAQPLVLVGTVAALVVAQRRFGGSAAERNEVAELLTTTLTYPLTLLMLLQLVYAATAREVGVVVVAASLCLLLALGTDADGAEAAMLTSSGLAATATLAAGLVTLWLLHRLRERAAAHYVVHGRRGGTAGAVLLVAAALVVGSMALLLPAPEGVQAARSDGFGTTGSASGGSEGGSSRLLNYLNPQMDLNSRGDLPTEPLLAVPLDSPALWGGSVLDRYDGRIWSATASRAVPLPQDASGAYDARPGATAGLAPGVADRTDPVRLLSTSALLPVVAPGALVSVQSPVRPLRFDNQVGLMGEAEAYVVRSTASVAGGPTATDTTLPAHVPDRVHRLAETLTRGAPTVEGKIAAIEAYLREHLRYRLDAPVAPAGVDAVDFFLFEAKEGFCEHFASAAAVMLRSVGVPARVVTGFAGGEPSGGVRVVTGEQAHAWVQFYAGDDTWGWTDPTAGSTLASEDAVAGFLEQHGLAAAVAIAVLVLLTVLFVVVVRLAGRRTAARRAAAAPLPAKVLAAFGSLERSLASTSLARRPEQSVAEFAMALRTRWPGGLVDPAASDAAFRTVQRLAYGPDDLPDDELHLALGQLRSLTGHSREMVRTERRKTGWRRLLPASRSPRPVAI
jgi:hypothetical protein